MNDDYFFGHQADDPPVTDLDQWSNEGTADVPLWVQHSQRYNIRAQGRYRYFLWMREDHAYTWSCLNDETEERHGKFATPEEALADLRQFHAKQIAKAKEFAATNETDSTQTAGDVAMPDDELQRILGGPSEDAFDDRPRPVRYALTFYEGTFKNDSCGFFDSTTPFMPISVGDFITSRSDISAVEGKLYRVTAVQHTINWYEDEVCHHVEVCIVKR
jgi:hypothetical protein